MYKILIYHFVNHLSTKYSNALHLKMIKNLTSMSCYLSHLNIYKKKTIIRRYKTKKLFIRFLNILWLGAV